MNILLAIQQPETIADLVGTVAIWAIAALVVLLLPVVFYSFVLGARDDWRTRREHRRMIEQAEYREALGRSVK